MELCNLCPRECNVDRSKTLGFCKRDEKMRIAKIMKHHWEEPPISGSLGSGTVFFSGCPLRCVYCQNCQISRTNNGKIFTKEELIEKLWSIKDKVHNINLVTGTHEVNNLIPVLESLKIDNYPLPILWNTSSYEKVDTLKRLSGLIDIYLADFKYMDSNLSKRYSSALDYPEVAKEAFKEMFHQVGTFIIDGEIMKKGIIARHLVLPTNVEDSLDIVDYLFENFGNKIIYSLMGQYSPGNRVKNFPEINKKVTKEEYDRLVNYSWALGLENVFIQDLKSATEDFIPDFSREEFL